MTKLPTLRPLLATLALAAPAVLPSAALQSPAAMVDEYAGKPRVIVLSDIGNEPDDQMSLVRFLVYSNEMEVEGLIATTSVWQRTIVRPDTMRELVAAYGEVRPNLMRHAHGWPSTERLAGMIAAGQPAYGMEAVGAGKDTAGSNAIIRAVDRRDPRPIWISVWGGANTLAQALWTVRATRAPEELARFIAKLRIYSISDQDDAGAWIRQTFPGIHYIVYPTSQNGEEYSYATWTGIAGDLFYRNGEGADFSTVTNEWLDRNIRSKGPLGRHYPHYAYIMEGDTPAFLGLVDNGLASYRSPSWGGWSGRHVYRKPRAEPHAIWTQGGDAGGRVSSQDVVTGMDGRIRVSDQATIWRWRTHFQHDFAARMDWTVKPFGQANHNPLAVVNGRRGSDVIRLDAQVGKPLRLDASASSDRDRDGLSYRWFHYAEAGASTGQSLADLRIDGAETASATVTPIATCRPRWRQTKPGCPKDGVAHVILAVTDAGTPSLTSYRRIILTVRSPD